MLKHIQIQNYAIIQSLEINFPEGMTVITGETGAGKSILLGALGLVMGKRADSKVLFDMNSKCMIEAVFDISEYQLSDWFEEYDLDYHSELLVRREISTSGKSRAFVNDTPVTLDVLQSLTDELIDIHQQFDILNIQKPSIQVEILDALAGNKVEVAEYKKLFKKYRNLQLTYNELLLEEDKNAAEIQLLKFNFEEIEQANLKAGELISLEQDLKRLQAGEEIKKTSEEIVNGLENSENSLSDQLQSFLNALTSIRNVDNDLETIYQRLYSIREEIMDISRTASHISDSVEFDDEMIYNISQRVNTINRLLNKYKVISDDELLAIQEDFKSKLGSYSSLRENLYSTKQEIDALEIKLRKAAIEIGEKRKSVIPKFEDEVQELLIELAMPNAKLKVEMVDLEELSPTGLQSIQFLFSANKGNPLLPIKDVASGGEISRLTLVIKSLSSAAMTLPTLIFDEIDTGISGDVALKMGAILSQMAKKHQLITITHSPQIASKGLNHLYVFKKDTKDRTLTSLKTLKQDERVFEIGKMLSGDPPTQGAILNAKELLDAVTR